MSVAGNVAAELFAKFIRGVDLLAVGLVGDCSAGGGVSGAATVLVLIFVAEVILFRFVEIMSHDDGPECLEVSDGFEGGS